MDMSDLHEHLLRLYLRLNGFFTSDFIVHSSETAKNKTEVDTIGVRFPNNGEPERQGKPDPWLDLSKHNVEFAICEAKTKPRFNRALYCDKRAIETILRWGGMFTPATLIKLVPKVQAILSPERKPSATIRRTEPYDGVVVRSLLFCPASTSGAANRLPRCMGFSEMQNNAAILRRCNIKVIALHFSRRTWN